MQGTWSNVQLEQARPPRASQRTFFDRHSSQAARARLLLCWGASSAAACEAAADAEAAASISVRTLGFNMLKRRGLSCTSIEVGC